LPIQNGKETKWWLGGREEVGWTNKFHMCFCMFIVIFKK